MTYRLLQASAHDTGLPDSLHNMRKHKKMTLKQVAERTGLSVSFLSHIEHGRVEPSLTTLRKLSACYQCGITVVIEGSPDLLP